MGVSYLGFSLGPALGAFLIRHPLPQIQSFGRENHEMDSVTTAFWAAILFSTINLLLSLLVIPESLDKARRLAARKVDPTVTAPVAQNRSNFKERVLSPLAVFLPRRIVVNGRMQRDWSMSWLAMAVFILFLASVRNLALFKIPFVVKSKGPSLTGRLSTQVLICGTCIWLGCRTGVYISGNRKRAIDCDIVGLLH
jgi:MFS family permease